MMFRAIDNYHAESHDGYRISVCFTGGEKTYSAWEKGERKKWTLIENSVSKSKQHVIQAVNEHHHEAKRLSS